MESTPQCHFVYFTGPRAGQAEAFHSARVTIGRSSDSDFHIEPGYDEVSAQHAEIIVEEAGRWVINDLNSRGGTYINGQRIKERQVLLPEDYVRFSRNGPEVIFRIGPPVPGYQPIPALTAEDAQLQFFSGSDRGKTFTVSGSGVTRIGRRAENEVCLDPRGDMIVSGNHCSIVFEDGAFLLTDTSRNGTYVNGQLVEGSIPIVDGDVIMLGDGGPEGRFRAKSAGVIYPNLRAYYHAAKNQSAVDAASDNAATAPPQQPDMFSTTGAASASVPPVRRYPMYEESRRRVWPWIVMLLLVAIGAGYWYKRHHNLPAALIPAALRTPDYVTATRAGEPRQNQVGMYSVVLPDGWALRQQDALFSIESPDKELAVDYARSTSLTEPNVLKLLAQNNVPAARLPAFGRKGDSELVAYLAKGSGVARIAVLHRPNGEVPLLAMLEAPDNLFAKLPDDLLRALLIDNVKTSRVAAPATPTPSPTATPRPSPSPSNRVIAQITATPAATVSRTPAPVPGKPSPSPSPSATGTPASTLTPVPVATPMGTPVEVAASPSPQSTTSGPAGTAAGQHAQSITSEKLALSIELPQAWSGAADEQEGIINLTDPENLQVSIARNQKNVKLDSVLSSMAREGWTRAGVRKKTSFSMAELKREDEDLILVVIPEPKTGTSLLVYASRTGEITEAQRNGIVQVVQQLRPSTAAASGDR